VSSPALLDVLERARRLGVLGPGPVQEHVGHAQAFLRALDRIPAGSRVVDLGSGAGVPGLVIAEERPDLELVLVDAMEKRAALLREAVVALGAQGRVTVVADRAEVVGRGPLRGSADVVVARSFGPPAVVAECAAPLLADDGLLVVSEPPGRPERWPAEGLAALGLRSAEQFVPGVRVLDRVSPCPDRYPRRNGVPAKRPLF